MSTAANGALGLNLCDNWQRHWLEVIDGLYPERNVRSAREWNWTTGRGAITPSKLHHVVFIVDGLANVVSVLIDGVLCDGGTSWIQGWWRLNPWLDDLNGHGLCTVDKGFAGRIECLRIYDRYLRTSEEIGSFRAGTDRV